ncbi:hypothetical protein F2P81_024296 [Scophthalmus maximus]|uniref:Uncharacterized protein n=1 Tax=Scophthalmus maximus TaxID=52904 RepID=A0A6A4RMC5_SCOMX|nr:hypothetical protein F2P81_024296 [Scophthalmus maximus]
MTKPFLSEAYGFGSCICLTPANGKQICRDEKKECSPGPSVCKCQARQTPVSDYRGGSDKQMQRPVRLISSEVREGHRNNSKGSTQRKNNARLSCDIRQGGRRPSCDNTPSQEFHTEIYVRKYDRLKLTWFPTVSWHRRKLQRENFSQTTEITNVADPGGATPAQV